MQVQRHGLLGDRRPQPLDLRPSLLQLDLLPSPARPPRHRLRQRIERALLGCPADRDDRGTVDPPLVGGLALGGLLAGLPKIMSTRGAECAL